MDSDPDILGKIDKVLGIKWLPTEDLLEYKFEASLSSKLRGKRDEGPKLTLKDVNMVKAHKFTRRETLGISHQLYDPLGLTASYIMKLKVWLRELVLLKLDWDGISTSPSSRTSGGSSGSRRSSQQLPSSSPDQSGSRSMWEGLRF